MDPFWLAVDLVATPYMFVIIMSGVVIGVLVGALPGLSSPMAVALLIPFTITLQPVEAVALLAALYCAGTFGGSITAILINAPGAPPAAATALDGYPMAKRGEAGRALGIAAASSVVGGLLSLIVFLTAAPALASVALSFGPSEYFALAVFALSMLASISGKSSLRNLIMGFIGVLLATVGVHLTTGVERFTFDIPQLSDGIHFVPVLIGLFAMSELLTQCGAKIQMKERISSVVVKLPSIKELKALSGTILRSSGIGTFIGILPAEGATVAALLSYNEAKRFSKNKAMFGHGAPEGIAAPEAANNAATGGAMVPTLALGIPGSGTTALILAAMYAHGLQPGPYLVRETPEIMYAVFLSMIVANLGFLVVGLVGAKFFARVTLIPKTFLWPSVFCFSVIGSYAYGGVFDIWVMVVSGAIGYFLNRFHFSAAPLVMGLILGKILEETFSQAMIIHESNFLEFFESPIVLMFFLMTTLSLLWPIISAKRLARAEAKELTKMESRP
ncbi:MAG: tripartite tricarboxylate transporter permease [Verrucomicrobia bacterium]|nr:tripartite tricarboxylate transporter permease [Verrucomicrobiota bacterium]